MKEVRIVFMGTPDFAVESLKRLQSEKYNVVLVVTTPDKPAGRGLKVQESEVKKFSLDNGLPFQQPENLEDEYFLNTIKTLSPDLIIVVAFRKIPDILIKIPRIASFNLHASLLPDYRGAAPINWAIINGETETGLTTFLLNNKIDTGEIILQKKVAILPEYNASRLYDIMKTEGAELVCNTVKTIIHGNYQAIDQESIVKNDNYFKKAPKILKENCKINWHGKAISIHNQIRGLSYVPGAYSDFIPPDGKKIQFKVFRSEYAVIAHKMLPGFIETDNKTYLRIYTSDGFIDIKEIQLSGKRIMNINELLRGLKLSILWKLA